MAPCRTESEPTWTAVFVRDQDGLVLGTVAELPGVIVEAATLDEARRRLQKAVREALAEEEEGLSAQFLCLERFALERG